MKTTKSYLSRRMPDPPPPPDPDPEDPKPKPEGGGFKPSALTR